MTVGPSQWTDKINCAWILISIHVELINMHLSISNFLSNLSSIRLCKFVNPIQNIVSSMAHTFFQPSKLINVTLCALNYKSFKKYLLIYFILILKKKKATLKKY